MTDRGRSGSRRLWTLTAVASLALPVASSCHQGSSTIVRPSTVAESTVVSSALDTSGDLGSEGQQSVSASPGTGSVMNSDDRNGVLGQVVMWPSCPAENSSECTAPEPADGVIQVRSSTTGVVAATAETSAGHFRIPLTPGEYRLEAIVDGMICTPVQVTVPPGDWFQVEVRCDSGVR